MSLDNKAITDAIVRLASDMASIFSIVNAADFETEIFTKSKQACDLVNKTAVAGEKNKLPTLHEVKHMADTVNYFASLVLKKKALNPLVSNELVSMVTTAQTDANNIISLYVAV